MIKQSQICNFVSLIKALKNQVIPRKNYLSSQLSKEKSPSRKNSMRVSTYGKKISNSHDKFDFQASNNFSSQEVYYELRTQQKQQTLKKKNLLSSYYKQKKNNQINLTKFQNLSLHKFPQLSCDGTSFIKYNKILHRRSSSSQISNCKNRIKYNVMKIENSQDLKIRSIQNTTRDKYRQGKMGRKYTSKNTRQIQKEFNQKQQNSKDDSFKKQKLQQLTKRSRNQYSKAEKQVGRPATKTTKPMVKDNWVLDPWEQPFQSRQSIY